ncbi:MAG: hypothetical protein IPK16_20280 [Anaerolineales bacterium]|nr:hypothetical protein [Anaerolineales bacterium]
MQTVITIVVFCTLLLLLTLLPAWEQSIETQQKVESTSPSPAGGLHLQPGNGAGLAPVAFGVMRAVLRVAA